MVSKWLEGTYWTLCFDICGIAILKILLRDEICMTKVGWSVMTTLTNPKLGIYVAMQMTKRVSQ